MRFSIVMFNRQSLPASSAGLRKTSNPRSTEALRITPSIAPRSAAFEDLALPLFPSLCSHAFWLVRNEAEADELVKEALTMAPRAFDSFRPFTNFKAWIFRILRNTFFTSRTGIAASRTIFIEDHLDVLHTHDAGPTP
jgi:DNA-directed RNA polymerase specialized sigma24 family protein